MDLLVETLELVAVRRDHHSGLYSIEMPTRREVDRLWRIIGVKVSAPDYDDKFWTDLWNLVQIKLPTFKVIAAEMSNYGKVQRATETTTMTTSTTRAAAYNARHVAIREMSGVQAIAECENMGIKVTTHPTNPGITAMRAKNALYTKARHQNPPALADAA
jgi:hypothetical protein